MSARPQQSEAPKVVPIRASRDASDLMAEFKAIAGMSEARRAAFPNLKAKMAWIEGQLDRVPKNGYNSEHKYHFVRESDLVDTLRSVLSEANVSLSFAPIHGATRIEEFTSKSGSKGTDAFIELGMTIRNGDEPYDEITETFPGQGRDWSDKAIPKAMTTAKKYAMILTFAMSSGDDVENGPAIDKGASSGDIGRTGPAPIDSAMMVTIGGLGTKLGFSEERWTRACEHVSGSRAKRIQDLYAPEGAKLLAYLKKADAEAEAAKKDAAALAGAIIDDEVTYCPSCGAQRSPSAHAQPHAENCELAATDGGER
jgi:hypothetical protein